MKTVIMKSRYDTFETRKAAYSTPAIIEVLINGARSQKMNPHIPMTPEEKALEAVRCWDAGANAIHAHGSDTNLKGEDAYADYMKIFGPATEQCPDMLWYGTTCHPDLLTEEEHGIEHSILMAQRNPGVRLACVDPGYVNIPLFYKSDGEIFGVRYGYTLDKTSGQVLACVKNNVGIIWGIYETGYLRTALDFIKRGLSPKGSYIDLYLFGDYGMMSMTPNNTVGAPATVESLYFYLDIMEQAGYTGRWALSIWGAGEKDMRPLMKRAVELGGHLKVGLELHFGPTNKPTNLELLKEAQDIVFEVGRPLAKQGVF
jgi:uncharacterized protein (DUF849 family)